MLLALFPLCLQRLLAVPFVGKDVPSIASEFSHPDIQIGLAVLAYRYEGLRLTDFLHVMRNLRAECEDEYGPFNKRKSCLTFVRWVQLAGGRVRGFKKCGTPVTKEEAAVARAAAVEEDAAVAAAAASATSLARKSSILDDGEDDDNPEERNGDDFENIWPLQLLDLRDEEQMTLLYVRYIPLAFFACVDHSRLLVQPRPCSSVECFIILFSSSPGRANRYKLLKFSPHMVQTYLEEYIFPETMEHQGLKLSSSGQDLGGDMLFKTKLGFSGTPSDLLPVELGNCNYEQGIDGEVMHTLTNTRIVNYDMLSAGWSVAGLLRRVATASPGYHALIDTGALVTGMTNAEVALFLLKAGLPEMDGASAALRCICPLCFCCSCLRSVVIYARC